MIKNPHGAHVKLEIEELVEGKGDPEEEGSGGCDCSSGGTSNARPEQDIYSIGSMNYRYGEGRKTQEGMEEKYSHLDRGVGGWNAPIQRGQAKVRGEQALPQPAPREDGKQDFGKGDYGAFVNALTNVNQGERPTAKQSLEAPYLQDSLMQDHEAQEFLKARIKGKTDAPPAPPPLPELSQNTGTRQDHKHKTDMQKELLKVTKGKRKSLDKEAKARSKDPEVKKAIKKVKKAKKDLEKGKVPEPQPTPDDESSSEGSPDFY